MKIECIATAHFDDTNHGSFTKGDRVFLDDRVAERFESMGLVKRIRPIEATVEAETQSGPDESSLSSPVAPASQTPILKRRGRPRLS